MKTSIQCESVSDVGKQSVCRKAYLASYYLKNKIKIAAKKALYDAENREKKLVYLSNNKERIAARRAVYHALNREKILSKMFLYRLQNKDRLNECSRIYYKDNKNKIAAHKAAYHTANPEIKRINNQNRKALVRVSGGKLSKGLCEKLFKLQKGKCACCGNLLSDNYHLDHIMPIALGGANEDWNIQLLRGECNLQKHAKHPVDFMQSKGFLL